MQNTEPFAIMNKSFGKPNRRDEVFAFSNFLKEKKAEGKIIDFNFIPIIDKADIKTQRYNQSTGYQHGFPSFLVFVNTPKSNKGMTMVCMNIFDADGFAICEKDRDWLKRLQKSRIACSLCKGAREGIVFLESIFPE